MLGIDPEAAAEFKSQVLPMMKDTQEYKKSSLEIKALENKPQLAAQWTFQGKPNYLSSWVKDRWDIDISPVNAKMTDVSKIIREQSGGDAGLARSLKNDFKADLKAAQETFMATNALTDFSQGQGQGQIQGGYSMPTGYLDKPVVDPANISGTKTDYIQEQNPESSHAGTVWRSNIMDREIGNLGVEVSPTPAMPYSTWAGKALALPGIDKTVGNVSDIITKTLNGIAGYLADGINLFTGTVAGDKVRGNAEDAKDWYDDGRGHRYFSIKPQDLEKAKKDPLSFYNSLEDKDK
jgi:hypothetical protein